MQLANVTVNNKQLAVSSVLGCSGPVLTKATVIYSFGHGLHSLTVVIKSTQPPVLCGMVKWLSPFWVCNDSSVGWRWQRSTGGPDLFMLIADINKMYLFLNLQLKWITSTCCLFLSHFRKCISVIKWRLYEHWYWTRFLYVNCRYNWGAFIFEPHVFSICTVSYTNTDVFCSFVGI